MVFKLVSAFGILPANRYYLVKSLIALSHDWANYHIAYRVTQHQQKQPPNQTQATRLLAEKTHLTCCLNNKLVLYFNVSYQRQLIHN